MLRRTPSRRKRRKAALTATCLLLLAFFVTVYSHGQNYLKAVVIHDDTASIPSGARPINALLKKHAVLWRSLFELILNNDPLCSKYPEIVVPQELNVGFLPDHNHARPDLLWMEQADVQRMKMAHSNFVADLRKSSLAPVYNVGTKGIVTTAPTSQLATLVISLHMLRHTGSTLPVEIFIDRPSAYADAFCASIFPALQANCFYLQDIFTEASTGVEIGSYQFKVLAILFSSFEDVLLLDADAWPLQNPEPLFTSPPFSETGLVLWPDFWYASESPYYFEIAKIDNPPLMNLRPATESGEVLYSKSKHGLSILLATYYNYYGPNYYYVLQSQGAPGQGDKETFVWATTAMAEDFYFVKSNVEALGHHDSGGDFVGSAMLQFDPVNDFFKAQQQQQQQQSLSYRTDSSEEKNKNSKDSQKLTHSVGAGARYDPKPQFVHANFPKFDPYTIFNDDIDGHRSPTRDSNGTSVRCWANSHDEAVQKFGGVDVEERFWRTILDVACGELVGLWVGEHTPSAQDREMVRKRDLLICEKVKTYFEEVFGKVN